MVQGLHSVGMMDDTTIEWSKLVDQSFLPPDLRRKL